MKIVNGFTVENDISTIDVELLENYDFTVSDVENEKKDLIKNSILNRIGILNNLINDKNYIKDFKTPMYLNSINDMLFYLIKSDIDNIFNCIDKFINENELENVIERYNYLENEYKKRYLKKLNNTKNVVTE